MISLTCTPHCRCVCCLLAPAGQWKANETPVVHKHPQEPSTHTSRPLSQLTLAPVTHQLSPLLMPQSHPQPPFSSFCICVSLAPQAAPILPALPNPDCLFHLVCPWWPLPPPTATSSPPFHTSQVVFACTLSTPYLPPLPCYPLCPTTPSALLPCCPSAAHTLQWRGPCGAHAVPGQRGQLPGEQAADAGGVRH